MGQPSTPTAQNRTGADNKPVIFLAFANDRDDTVGYLRNLPDEARRLREVLRPAEQAGLCEVIVRANCTAGDIFKVFQDPQNRDRIAIFHYGGHANGYQLLLESASGESAAADAGGLAAFLAHQQGLQLVFLNGCSTQQQTQGLLDANISSVISTSRSIDDQVATEFANQFYQGLAGGASVRTAYNEAAAAVQTAKGGNTRALYLGDADDSQSSLEADRWPWNLYLREGSEIADRWNLPEAASDPLFGLPPLVEHDLPESPYRHLHWFRREDAEVFFGRGHQIRELYDRLTAPRAAPILLFYGQSGVGKSSLLDAGLIPRLEHDHDVVYLRRNEAGLLDTLRLAFLPEAMDVPIEDAWRAKEEQLGKPLIVFLDQVEELKTRPIADLPDEWNQLLGAVMAIFNDPNRRPRGKLVFGFRKEWLAETEKELRKHELPRTKVFLEPLDRRGIIEVVKGPTRSERLRQRYGLTIEDELAETIADDLLADRDSAIAPTLQILLTKLWAKATEENYEHPQFTHELYQNLKRNGILLRDFLNQQIAAFHQRYPEAVDSGLLLDIVALHTTPLGTADQQSLENLQRQYAHLGVTLPELLQQCQDLHLLTVTASAKKESEKTTRLAHDTLAPLVRERFESSDKPGQRARRILDNRSVDWVGDREGTPLDEADLGIVEKGIAGTRSPTPTEERLLEASRQLRAKLQRTRRLLRVAMVVAVASITSMAIIAWLERGEAIDALALAETNRSMARELMSSMVPELAAADWFDDADKLKLADASLIYFQKFIDEHSADEASLAVLADAQYAIGKILLDMEEFDGAVLAYETAYEWQSKKLNLATIADLRVTSSNIGSIKDLGFTLNELGHAYRERGDDFETAKSWYTEAESVRGKIADFEPDEIENRLLRASSMMNIGIAENNLSEFENAEKHLKDAGKACRNLLDAQPGELDQPTIERHIALGNLNLAGMRRNRDRKQAMDLLNEAIELYRKQSEADLPIQAELATCYEMRGQLELEQLRGETFDPVNMTLGQLDLAELDIKDASVAIEDYENAAEICRVLTDKRSWVSKYRLQRTDLSLVLIKLYEPQLRHESDVATLMKVQACWKSLHEIDRAGVLRDVENESELDLWRFVESSLQYAFASIDLENWDIASGQLEADLRLLSERIPKHAGNQVVVGFLNQFEQLMADVDAMDVDAALDAVDEALDRLNELRVSESAKHEPAGEEGPGIPPAKIDNR